ncbi:MAG: cytochrome c3 family protein [Planctomycetota bacterium]
MSVLTRLRMALLFVLSLGTIACEPTNRGYAPEQPVVYSHAVHAGALQIPCQYCHFGAAEGRYAGVPPASICMNCHQQVLPDHPEIQKVQGAIATERPIEWVRVHRLPDHATFDHSIHVAAEVACQTCHGPVETMGRVEQWAPLTMGWCLDCHRQGGGIETAQIAPRPAGRGNELTDCSLCHH